MKKKLIQFLMLPIVAVSIGAFVSCKDTNEDLYNEFRTEAKVKEQNVNDRLADLEQQLEDQIEAYKALQTALSTTGCQCGLPGSATDNRFTKIENDLNNLLLWLGMGSSSGSGGGGGGSSTTGGNIGGAVIDDSGTKLGDYLNMLLTLINGNTSAINTNSTDIANLLNQLNTQTTNLSNLTTIVNQQGSNINLLLTNQATADALLQQTIQDLQALQTQVNNIKQCGCDLSTIWTAINTLETGLTQAQADAAAALGLATTANTNANTALGTANTALSTANGAALTAGEAKAAADAATQIANTATTLAQAAAAAAATAQQTAEAAGADAATAKQIGEAAQQAATNALNAANSAIAMATTLETRVGANETAIASLQSNIQTIQSTLTQYGTQIGANTDAIAANTTAIATNVANIQQNTQDIQKNANDILAIQTQISTLSTDVANALQKAIDAEAAANANAQAIQNLQTTVATNQAAITALQTTTQTLETNVSNLTTQVNTNTTDIANLTTSVTNLSSTVTTLNTTVTDLQTTVSNHTTQLSTMAAQLSQIEADCAANLATAKAYADAQIAAAKTEIINQVTQMLLNYYTKAEVDALLANQDIKIDGNTLRIGNLETDLSTLTSTVNGHTTSINSINDQIAYIMQHLCNCTPVDLTEILDRLTAAEGGISTNASAISTNATAIQEIKDQIANVINKNIDDLTAALATTDGKVDALQLVIDNLQYVTPEQLDNIVNVIVAKAKADSTLFAQTDEELKKRIGEISDSVKTAFTDIVNLTTLYNTLESTTVKKADYEADKTAILGRISTNETNIGELQAAVSNINDSITALRNDLTELTTRMDAAEQYLAQVLNDIQDIKSDVAAIQDYLAKQVTSIKVQGTMNPWFGRFSMPANVSTNLLLAFYGLPEDNVEFPTSSTSNYVREREALTEKDMEMLSGLSVKKFRANVPIMYEDGYAGKIYMTINPNTADVSGLQPKIVNTLDEESYITLEGVQPSTDKLEFGWTRADQSSNGFYEAKAVVKPIDVQKIDAPAFNTPAIKDAMANVKAAITDIAKSSSTNGQGARLEQIASDINTVVQGLRFEQSGLKVSYTSKEKDENGNQVEKEHAVHSEYNLAATAFQPLSLATAKDFNYQTVPGYEQVNSLLDRVSNTLKDKINTFFKDFSNNGLINKLANFKIDSIKVPEITDDLLAKFELHMDTVFIMGGLEYHFEMPVTVPVKFEKDLEIPVVINDIEVNVPVHIDDSVAVDLSNVSITTPTIVVTGTASGHPTGVTDSDGKPVTVLVIPVLDNQGLPVKDQYVYIPIENFNVSVAIEASNTGEGGNAGQLIYLDGEPVAHVVIDDTISTTVDIDTKVKYHLVIEENVTVNISKYIQLGYVDYLRDPNEQDGYAKDENGNLIPLMDENGNPLPGDKRGFILRFNYDMRDAAQELWGMAADALDDINGGLLANVQDLINEVNKTLKQINNYDDKITGTISDFTEKIKNYLDKINTAAVRIINSTNQRFQPFMVASTSKGMKRLSGSKHYPTVLTSDVTLYPTSQTMELFVPLARKHVAVTNVFKGTESAQKGNSDCVARLRAANTGQFNTVLDGNVRKLDISAFVPGYVYEVAYSALDFHGKMATRKYYITVQ